MAAFTPTYYAVVNTTDGTVTSTGQTTIDQSNVPQGAIALSQDQFNTIVAAGTDGLQCRLVGGVVRLIPVATPAATDLASIQASAYATIDAAAEAARAGFLTEGSGQALEYQETSDEAEQLLAALGLTPGPASCIVAVQTTPPRAWTVQPQAITSTTAPSVTINPADYPFLTAEQSALASIGQIVSLTDVAVLVHQQMIAWEQVGSVIKQIRRSAKLQVSVATTAGQISAILSALTWPAPLPPGP